MSIGTGVDAEFTTLVHILADVGGRVQLRSSRTNALETARRVAALTTVAEQIVDGAFVYVCAMFTRTVHLVARIAHATVSSQQILARSIRAHVGVLSALVNVFKSTVTQSIKPLDLQSINEKIFNTVATVRFAGTERTELFKLFTVRQRTGLAGSAPTHRLAEDNGATTATRFCDQRSGRIEALTVAEMGVADVPP